MLYRGATIVPVELPPTLPYRHPVILAKRLATIDVLSKGRMRLLTVGLGGLPGGGGGGRGGLRAASPSRTEPPTCRSMSAGRAGRRPAAPAGAGRDPQALEYTRWSSTELTPSGRRPSPPRV